MTFGHQKRGVLASIVAIVRLGGNAIEEVAIEVLEDVAALEQTGACSARGDSACRTPGKQGDANENQCHSHQL